MKKGEIRIFLVIISLVLSLALLWTGFTLYNKYLIKVPVVKKLEKMHEVEKVEISQGKPYRITVKLKQVDNLMEVYEQIQTVLDDKPGKDKYILNIEDKPDGKLTEIFYSLQPAIYEAIEKSNYTWLEDYLAKKLAKEGLKCRMFMDGENIYLQIMQNDDHYLYAVINRQREFKN